MDVEEVIRLDMEQLVSLLQQELNFGEKRASGRFTLEVADPTLHRKPYLQANRRVRNL